MNNFPIVLVRLLTGDELIAKLETGANPTCPEASAEYVLHRPMRIIANPSPDGRLQVALAAATPFMNDKKELHLRGLSIIFISEPQENMLSIYKQTTSPLVLPSSSQSGIILG